MKHLKSFKTETEYTSYKNGSDFVLPNVSYVEENDTVYYEAEEEFAEDELLYYFNGSADKFIINLTTLKVKKYGGYSGFVYERDLNIDENGNVVIDVNSHVPGYSSAKAMYWTSESVNTTPMNFEYILYDSSSNVTFSGEFNEMVTFSFDSMYSIDAPNEVIDLSRYNVSTISPIMEIKSKISNKTHKILFV